MRFLRQSMIGLFLAAATLGLLVYAVMLVGGAVQDRLADEGRAPPARERVFSVNVVTAVQEDIEPLLETYGEIRSRRLLELRAAVGGRIIELSPDFEDGGNVAAGQVLVRLDPADAQAALDRAASDVADARAEARDAARGLTLAQDELSAAEEQAALRERAFERQRDLGDRGVGTATATETAELAASAARQAALARRQAAALAEARVDQAATSLARSRIALSETSVVVGRLASANERLADLIDAEDLEVSFRISTAQYVRLLEDDGALIAAPVTVTLDVAGVDLQATGRITRASAGAGEGASGRLLFATLDRAAGFKPGDFVAVSVREPLLQDVFALPAASLGADGAVLALDDENRLESVAVELMRRQGDSVLVRGPLSGREVVEARSPLLGAGIAVKPLRRAATPDTPPVDAEMVALTDERRAELVALVEANPRMPEDAKARVLSMLANAQVPAQMIARLESRRGG